MKTTYNKILFTLLATFGCASSLTTLASKSSAVEFSEVMISTPYKLSQEVIAADVLPNKGKELVTFSVDEQSNRWLIIYQLNQNKNQYVVAEKAMIPKQFYRFDISEPKDQKKQKLYFLSTDSLS
ncbi:MAG: hypothetical protein ACJAXH_003014, partial [Colwellia sp.]